MARVRRGVGVSRANTTAAGAEAGRAGVGGGGGMAGAGARGGGGRGEGGRRVWVKPAGGGRPDGWGGRVMRERPSAVPMKPPMVRMLVFMPVAAPVCSRGTFWTI